MTGFFAPDNAGSADRAVAPAGDPQGDCWEWAGRFIFFRQIWQVTLPGSAVFGRKPEPGPRHSAARLGVRKWTTVPGSGSNVP